MMYETYKNYNQMKINYLPIEQVSIPSSPPPNIKTYIARPNGLDQRWIFDNVLWIKSGDTLSMEFLGGVVDNQYARFVSESSNDFTVDAGIDKDTFRLKGCTAELNGAPIINNSTSIPTEGRHILQIYPENTYGINDLLSYGSSRYGNLPIFNVKVTRPDVGEIFKVSLMDKDSGAAQVAETGNYVLTLEGYTFDVWEELLI